MRVELSFTCISLCARGPFPPAAPHPYPVTGREGMGRRGRGITAGLSQQATSPDEHAMESGKCEALYPVDADPGQPAQWI